MSKGQGGVKTSYVPTCITLEMVRETLPVSRPLSRIFFHTKTTSVTEWTSLQLATGNEKQMHLQKKRFLEEERKNKRRKLPRNLGSQVPL
jgi:hypothetical protein